MFKSITPAVRPWLLLYLGWMFLQIFLVCSADCMVPFHLAATLLGVVALMLARSRDDRIAGFIVCVISLGLTYGRWREAEQHWQSRFRGLSALIASARPAATQPASSRP